VTRSVHHRTHWRAGVRLAATTILVVSLTGVVGVPHAAAAPITAATPISHLVVIYDENVSFDHYFGTYPSAANTDGTPFTAASGTPTPNNLITSHTLTGNPNTHDPQRLGPAQALTCDQNHQYTPEQKAVHGGKMDRFVEYTSKDTCTGAFGSPGLTMAYYDGNTVSALWNYAQNYSLTDNNWDAVFGPSTPGHLNLVSGQTHGVISIDATTGKQTAKPDANVVHVPDANGIGTIITDPDPAYDDCSDNSHGAPAPPKSLDAVAALTGKNIGDLLNARGVTWGWFQGGFRANVAAADSPSGDAQCTTTHTNVGGAAVLDYSPHHDPFEYYRSTANPHHLPPSTSAMIGYNDQANHLYDLSDFNTALAAGTTPAVSFLKAPEYQDGHASYSDPIDEQTFLATEINAVERSPQWPNTAIVIAYDDSDGWYDHAPPTVTNGSDSSNDESVCTAVSTISGGYRNRCGPGQRLPMLVVSPFAKQNYIDHTPVSQPSILRFIEDNWATGRIGDSSLDASAGSIESMFDFTKPQQREVLVDPSTGNVSQIVPVSIGAAGTTTPNTVDAASTKASSGLLANSAVKIGGIAIVVIALFAGAWFWRARHRRNGQR
jgi:phospholipase C